MDIFDFNLNLYYIYDDDIYFNLVVGLTNDWCEITANDLNDLELYPYIDELWAFMKFSGAVNYDYPEDITYSIPNADPATTITLG